MKFITVVGARPQFIKAAPFSKVLRKEHEELLVHTGQHYDANMSDVFFDELEMPKPEFKLEVGSGHHGYQTGKMMVALEELYLREKPDGVIVYGDTNSTLAGALTASKLLIPVIHIEAGLRSFNKKMPEEQNRILTDHLSTLLFTPTETAVQNLKNENILEGVFNVGDIMFDAVKQFQSLAEKKSSILEKKNLAGTSYVLSTIHRAENTNSITRLIQIFEALGESEEYIVLPLHPRTKKYLRDNNVKIGNNISLIEPVGYLDMLILQANAQKIVTDSGGVQKEAYFMKKPCITLRDETEWIETVEAGWNLIVGADKVKILSAMASFEPKVYKENLFGNGTAAEQMVHRINLKMGLTNE